MVEYKDKVGKVAELDLNLDETIDYVDQNDAIKGIKPIKMYTEPDKDKCKPEEVKTDTIYPIKRGQFDWNYIKTKEGKEGWIDVSECYERLGELHLAG